MARTNSIQKQRKKSDLQIMNPLIELTNVYVKFRRYRNPFPSLKEFLINRLTRRAERDSHTDFYGLNNVTISIKPGERVGIVGPNGAGKSTLLKTIAGIYHPHQGTLAIQGNITPLMELGAGFDPEQTGRENIYLNGAMLGYPPSEMKKRELDISEFSELGEFLDTPLKYYSSGMFARLAFSIAVTLPAEILLIDEIFATGDAHFVQKSEAKLLNLINESQIVVFVSHNSDQIQKLCNRAILMNKGEVMADGKPSEVIDQYMHTFVDSQMG